MLARPLQKQNIGYNFSTGQTNNINFTDKKYIISEHGYGKDAVKILHVQRNGPVHSIKEFEVGTHLKLYTTKDYLQGDNSDIVATDSQKNTVYLLAKRHGIESPEKFALLLAKHFLSQYAHVEEAHVHVEEYPWQRVEQEKSNNQSVANKQSHNHAFVFVPTAQRTCDVVLRRNSPKITVISGLKGLRILKTTQSSFINFVNDEYRSLNDQHDRIFSTIVDCSWQYSNIENIKFCKTWNDIKEIIINNFAGDPNTGVPSPSVQNTLYLTEKNILEQYSQIGVVQMTMPNKHYFNFDTKPFQKLGLGENNEVFIPVDKPHGTIYAELSRKDLKSQL